MAGNLMTFVFPDLSRRSASDVADRKEKEVARNSFDSMRALATPLFCKLPLKCLFTSRARFDAQILYIYVRSSRPTSLSACAGPGRTAWWHRWTRASPGQTACSSPTSTTASRPCRCPAQSTRAALSHRCAILI